MIPIVAINPALADFIGSAPPPWGVSTEAMQNRLNWLHVTLPGGHPLFAVHDPLHNAGAIWDGSVERWGLLTPITREAFADVVGAVLRSQGAFPHSGQSGAH